MSEIDEASARGPQGRWDLIWGKRPRGLAIQRLVQFFRDRGTDQAEEFQVVQEDVRFMLPKAIRQAQAEATAV